MVLTDDNFSSIVTAVEEGRRVYDNVRKFIVYIFAHAVPEVVPFLVFALSGGAVPLPLTVILILCIDLGTETLPALALGREPAERGLMQRPPRPAHERSSRSRCSSGHGGCSASTSAVLTMVAFFYTLPACRMEPGRSGRCAVHTPPRVSPGDHGDFRGDRRVPGRHGDRVAHGARIASLVGVATNRLLLAGIAFELAFTAAVVYLPALNDVLATAPPPATSCRHRADARRCLGRRRAVPSTRAAYVPCQVPAEPRRGCSMKARSRVSSRDGLARLGGCRHGSGGPV